MSRSYPEPRRYSPHESMLDVLGRRVLVAVTSGVIGFVLGACLLIGERR